MRIFWSTCAIPPTFSLIDMLLSFRIITMGSPLAAGVRKSLVRQTAGKRAVADDGDNVITPPVTSLALAIPSATETEFDACPAINASSSLSDGFGKPDSPPY